MLAYVNGEFVAVDQASISIRDRGFSIGEGVFEVWRTYGGRTAPDILERHLVRLARSLRFIEINPDEVIDIVRSVWPEMVSRNQEKILQAGDVLVDTIITGGVGDKDVNGGRPTIVCTSRPVPFGKESFVAGENYSRSARLVPSLMSRNPFLPSDPRVKSISRMSNTRSMRKQAREGSGVWGITFDNNGFITEATTAAFAIVENGKLVTAPRWMRLDSVSLQVTCNLAQDLGIEIEERPMAVFDLLNADEVYVFVTSFSMLPVSDLDGIALNNGREVGDQLLAAWIEFVGFDFVEQSRRLDTVARRDGSYSLEPETL